MNKSFSRYEISSEEVKRLKHNEHRFVFQPSSITMFYWDLVVFVCLLFTAVREPAIWAFALEEDDVVGDLDALFVSIVFLLDTFLHFFRAKKKATREGVVLITDLRVLASAYMRRMFLVDFVSGIPFAYIWGHESRKLAIVRLLRFYHTPRLVANIQSHTTWSYSVLNLLEFGMMTALGLHWVACAWGGLAVRHPKRSWLTQLQLHSGCDFSVDPMATDPCWSWQAKPCLSDPAPFWELYELSLYWAVTVLSSVGFGDVTPTTHAEFVCAIISMAIGGCFWAYVVGSVCGMVFSMDKHRSAYESIMNDVNMICSERKLPQDLQGRVREFYRHAQEFMRMQEYHKTLHELSPSLKGEVVVWMYGSLFKRVWYFDIVDERTAHLLFEGMVPKMYAIGEWIEASVDHCRALVFLRSGLCVRKCSLLAPGAVWGLDVILGSEEYEDIEELLDKSVARSINFSFVLKLSKHSIDHAANLVPVFAKRIRKAHMRMLLWRGVIAASRATTRLSRTTQSQTPKWDLLGKLMGQVVHRDRLLLQGVHLPQFRRRHSSSGGLASPLPLQLPTFEFRRQVSDESALTDVSGLDKPSVPGKIRPSETEPHPHDSGEPPEDAEVQDTSDDAPWKAKIQSLMAQQEEKITNVQEELAGEVATLQDSVEELTRLMHTLLGRLDAEEKY